MTRACSWVLLALLCGGCGGEETDGGGKPTPPDEKVEVSVVAGAVGPGDAVADSAVAMEKTVAAIASLGGLTVVGGSDGAFAVAEDALTPLDNWSDEGPVAAGEVQHLLRRAGNVLVVADNGWFHTSGTMERLLWSPAGEAFAELDIAAMASIGAGDEEQIWLIGAQGVHQAVGGQLVQWIIEGEEDSAPSAILPTIDGVLVAFGGTVYQLDTATQQVSAIDYDFGHIYAMAPGLDGKTFFATDTGLLRRDDTLAFTHYTLAPEGETGAAVYALVLDPLEGVYALCDDALLIAGADAPAGITAIEDGQSARVSVDDFGTVFVSSSSAVEGFALGTPLSFASDVQPLMVDHCMQCHAAPGSNGAPPVAFDEHTTAVEYIDLMVSRISDGSMPPPGFDPITADELEIILRWQTSGLAQ